MSRQFEEALKNDSINDFDFMSNYTVDPFKTRNKALQSPLMLACANKGGKAAMSILQKLNEKELTHEEVDLNGTDPDGWTAIHFAAKSGSFKVIQLLVQEGASMASTTNKKATCLHISAREGDLEKVIYFLELGAKIDAVDDNQ